MDIEASYALLQKGAEEWHNWAADRQAKKDTESPTAWADNSRLDFRGKTLNQTAFEGFSFPGDVRFERVTFNARTSFNEAQFHGKVSFQEATFKHFSSFRTTQFHGATSFVGVKLIGATDFRSATFLADANFMSAEFSKQASFDSVTFIGSAEFDEAIFSALCWFRDAEFRRAATFKRVYFRGSTNFGRCQFRGPANFNAINAETAFDLENACFAEVPNFTQAHFLEAPQLDNVQVPLITECDSLMGRTNPEAAPRYRALKRLAIQGHDHDREIRFFADEIRSLRHHPDKPWHARYWAGLLYEAISNFGRSITRPLGLLTVSTICFAIIYASAAAPSACGKIFFWGLYLAVRRALIFPGLAADRKLDTAYECLYGKSVPQSIAYLEIAQTLLSAALIFLILLAVRNMFRIK